MRTLLILLLSSGTPNTILSDPTSKGYGAQPAIPTPVVEFFQKHFGPVGVRETGSAALFLLLGTVAVIVWLRALKRRQARRTGPTYLRFFGQSEWDTRSRVYGPPIEQKHHPNLES
jgi:hypothetical protein